MKEDTRSPLEVQHQINVPINELQDFILMLRRMKTEGAEKGDTNMVEECTRLIEEAVSQLPIPMYQS